MKKQIILALIVAAGLAGTASLAHALDLTGTWRGRQVCKITTAEGKRTTQVLANDVIAIAQTGDQVRILLTSVGPYLYTGKLFSYERSPNRGEAAFRLCGMTGDVDTVGEMGRANVFVPPSSIDLDSTFKATSIYTDADEVDTCEWSYRRTSIADPGAPTCP